MSSEGKLFKFEDIKSHNNVQDCWLAIGGKVYDVTRFLEDHPGGDEVLLSSTGKDATDDFEDVGHSTSARAMMEEYYIGEIDQSTLPSKPRYTIPKASKANADNSSKNLIKIFQFLVPLAILFIALAYSYFSKSS